VKTRAYAQRDAGLIEMEAGVLVGMVFLIVGIALLVRVREDSGV
jgi:hypothetical protein